MNITTEWINFFLGLGGAIAGFAIGGWRWIEGRVTKSEAATGAAIADVEAKAAAIRRDLDEHKLHVARTHPTHDNLAGMEARITSSLDSIKQSIDRHTARIDRVIERQGGGDNG